MVEFRWLHNKRSKYELPYVRHLGFVIRKKLWRRVLQRFKDDLSVECFVELLAKASQRSSERSAYP